MGAAVQGAEQGILSTYSVPRKGTCVQKPKKGGIDSVLFSEVKGLAGRKLTARLSQPFSGVQSGSNDAQRSSASAATWGGVWNSSLPSWRGRRFLPFLPSRGGPGLLT